MHYPIDCIIHTSAFGVPVKEHWMERNKAKIIDPLRRFDPTIQASKANAQPTELRSAIIKQGCIRVYRTHSEQAVIVHAVIVHAVIVHAYPVLS